MKHSYPRGLTLTVYKLEVDEITVCFHMLSFRL